MFSFKNFFTSEEFLNASSNEKKELILKEFIKCKNDITYFMENYVLIRHANEGVIQFKPFDFQKDLAKYIEIVLKHGKTKNAKEKLKGLKHNFNYKKWIEEQIDKLEMQNYIPEQLKQQYEIYINSPVYNELFDLIILKSRQVGASTLFSAITSWFINFYNNVVVLIISQRDKEAIKFLYDVKMIYKFIPQYIRSKHLKDTDHELFVSITGNKEHQSIAQAFAPTPNAGRGYSPNLVILDEFANYKKAEELLTAITFAVSTGGLIVILSTPKGVYNMFYKIWQESIKNLNVLISSNVNINSENFEINKNKIMYKPYVIHWTQLPLDEFKRRGYNHPVDWYESMSKMLISEHGEKAVAQELDLEFLTSGDTLISGKVIKSLYSLRNNQEYLEKNVKPLTIERLQSIDEKTINLYKLLSEVYKVKLYKLPEPNKEYIFGIDTAEGVEKDYSVIFCFEYEKDKLPDLAFYFYSNKIDTKNFALLISDLAKIYNNAYIHIEKNNTGLAVINTLLEVYSRYKVINAYQPNKPEDKIFNKQSKGYDTKQSTRNLLLNTFKIFIEENYEDIKIPHELFSEILTFINTGKKYEAQQGFHDDMVMAYSLGLFGCYLLDKYKTWSALYNIDEITEDDNIPIELSLVASNIKVDYSYYDTEKANNILENKIKKENEKTNDNRDSIYKFISSIENSLTDISDIYVF